MRFLLSVFLISFFIFFFGCKTTTEDEPTVPSSPAKPLEEPEEEVDLEKPQSIVVPVASLGDVSETRKKILQNTLEDELKENFMLISQERFEEDEDLHSRAIEILQDDSSLDVLFVAYDDPDYAGHRHGFSPLSEEYVEAVKLADQRAFELLEILDERITIGEDWLVIITSDHGRGGF